MITAKLVAGIIMIATLRYQSLPIQGKYTAQNCSALFLRVLEFPYRPSGELSLPLTTQSSTFHPSYKIQFLLGSISVRPVR